MTTTPTQASPPAVRRGHRGPALHPRTAALLVSAAATALLLSVTFLLPVPYVAMHPGPAFNVLGQDEGKPLISVSGRTTYPAKGALDLTTVTVAGGPGHRLSVVSAVLAWFDDDISLFPEREVFPPGQSAKDAKAENAEEMATSQEVATAAALHELGIAYTTRVVVRSVQRPVPGGLAAEDQIVSIDGTAVGDTDALRRLVSAHHPGDAVKVTVRRGGAEKVVTVTTAENAGRTVLGIRVAPTYAFPFQVRITINDVGGPSAGTMFALGIIDLLTPGDLTGGHRIAGTGEIDPDGTVSPIGGIQQKVLGARDAGAEYFLAPADNCRELRGHVPAGLTVLAVDTLHQARSAVAAIGSGRGVADLKHC